MKKTVFDLVGVLILRGASLIIAYPLAIILSRSLGSEEYGKYGVVVACYTLFSTIFVLGFDQLIVNKISSQFEKFTFLRVFCSFFTKKLFIWFITISIFTFSFQAYSDNNITEFLPFIIFCGVTLSFRKLHSGFLRSGKHPLPTQLAENIIQPTTVILLTLVMIYSNSITLENVLLSVIAGLLVSTFFQFRVGISIDDKKKINGNQPTSFLDIRTALPFFGIAITGELYVFADRFIITNLLGYSETGIFMIAVRNASLLLTIVAAFQLVLNPYFSAAHEKGDLDAMRVITACQTVSQFAIALFAAVILIVLSFNMTLIFGSEYASAKLPLMVISTLYFVSFFFGSALSYMYMSDNTYQAFYIGVFVLFIYGFLLLLLIPSYGLVGAAVATGFAELSKRILAFIYISIRLQLRVDLISSIMFLLKNRNHLQKFLNRKKVVK